MNHTANFEALPSAASTVPVGDAASETRRSALSRKVNLGCGPIQPDGWENVDGSIRAFFASRLPWLDGALTRVGLWPPTEFNRMTRFANLQKRLPWSDNEVDCVYLGEVLEHFTRLDGLRLLSECFRILRPGGIIRVRVPDNGRFWRQYVQELDAALAKPPAEWTEDHSRWVEMFFRDICVQRRVTGSYGHFHKWMYDEISLIKTFQRVGFVNVSRRDYLDSAIPGVRDVESHADLTVEGTKPGPGL
jgi:predicted SAM-dependent methyltransferase